MARHRAFTLIEILMVVVILAIMVSIVVPRFVNAASDSALTATKVELEKLRRHIEVYEARNLGTLPDVAEGNGTWGQIVVGNDYLLSAPINAWVGGANSKVITFGTDPDTSYHTDYGWIYDPTTGYVRAAAFDGEDQPFPR